MRALISVYDKTRIKEVAQVLAECGYEIIATSKTKTALENLGIPQLQLIDIANITGIGELLSGRIKTLHHIIYAAILAERTPTHIQELNKYDIKPIDVVVVNLYPFVEAVKKNLSPAEIIENIDIGGHTLIRAAVKNYKYVAILTHHTQYDAFIEDLKKNSGRGITDELRLRLAKEALEYISFYDCAVNEYFSSLEPSSKEAMLFPHFFTKSYILEDRLRYGENPHQAACFYKDIFKEDFFEKIHGKELSFNNLLDIQAAMDVLQEIEDIAHNKNTAVIIKHNISSGVAIAETQKEAFLGAYKSDETSAFGGIVGFNKEVQEDTAEVLKSIYVELILAPSFSQEALLILKEKKNLRLIKIDSKFNTNNNIYDFKLLNNGILLQEKNTHRITQKDLKFVTEKKPTEKQIKDMLFGFCVVKHLKSNAVVLVKDLVTVGIGAGQTSRIDALYNALRKAGDKTQESILASDGFFPFSDCVEIAAENKIAGIIQPGGSIRDAEIINKANKLNIPMVFTGIRYFKH